METLFNKLTGIRILFICILILATIIIQGCKKDWLEAKVDKKQAVPATVKDFQAILDNFNVLNSNTSPAINEVAADGHYYTDNDYALMPQFGVRQFQNAYAWTDNKTLYDNMADYTQPYYSVLNINIILDEAEKSNDVDLAGLTNVKAQALFHRGRLFFELAQVFAPPYNSLNANSDLGLPLRLSTDVTLPSVRSTLKQTYDQILSDLIEAKDGLPNTPSFLTRASKPAAFGLLAKVYLSMGDFANAFHFANEYLKLKNDLLDYATISPSANFIGVNKEVAFLNFLIPYAQLTSQYLIDQSLYDSYDNNDLRRQVFFKVGPAGITFKGHYSNSDSEIFAGIATDEMYLIRAEGYARAGNLNAAIKDLNDLLRTRYAKNGNGSTTYIDQTATNETDVLRKIFTERKKQLILRGVRWTDLRRLNQEERFKITLTRKIEGEIYNLEPNSFRYTFPIPQEVISKANMPQNVGW